MKTSRFLSGIVAFGLAASLAACGGASGGDGAASVSASAQSDIVGLVDTFGKTSAKNNTIFSSGPGDQTLRYYDESGKRVAFDDQDAFHENPGVSYTGSAVITLEGADDTKIDASNAVVRIVDNSMVHASDYILSDAASRLDGAWSDGSYTYTLSAGDIELNQYGIGDAVANPTTGTRNSGYEWTTMGGDGNGVYYLPFEVSGITYDGAEIDPITFTVAVFCYGRENSAVSDVTLAYQPLEVDESHTAGVAATDEPQWIWTTENEVATADGRAYLNDTFTDYVSVVWPEGTDASSITADDVTVTLSDEYGAEYVLQQETEYGEQEYAVISSAGETVVAVTYEQWSFYPAYSKMTVSVAKDDLAAEQTFDVASVNGDSIVQTGGGEQDGVPYTTIYSYNGATGLAIGDGVNVTYTLSYEDGDTTYYYDGTQLVDAATLPTVEEFDFRAGGMVTKPDLTFVTLSIESEDADEYGILEHYNIGVGGGHSYSMGTNFEPMTVDVDVDGETHAMTVNVSASADVAGHLLPGYNAYPSQQTYWGYTKRFQSGWLQDYSPKPEGLPYVDAYHGFAAGDGSNTLYDAVVTAAEAAAASGEAGGPGGPSGN